MEADYVVVGAGSAGCVLAARLSEDPGASVLLLEAGGEAGRREIRIPAAFSRLYRSEVDWGYSTVPQPRLDGREIVFPRGKVVGGSASINAQIALRGHRADYDGWGVPGWSWADVEPYFERSAAGGFALAPLRDPNPLTAAFVEAAVEAGIPRSPDLNAPEPEGVGLVTVNQRRGRRWSVADGYLAPARRRPNLTVLTGALATRILLGGDRAAGVACLRDGRSRELRARREVVLCAGAIGSPHLLLLSGIDPPGVGENLRDHVVGGVLASSTSTRTLYAAESPASVLRYLLLRRGPLTSNVAEAVALVRTRPELPAPDLELVFAPVLFDDEGLQPPSEHGLTIGTMPLQPASTGSVWLRSGDPLEPPAIDPAYLTAKEDVRVLLDGVRLARRLLATRALAPHVRAELLPGADAQSDEQLVEVMRAKAHTLYHPVGTCALGTVVDPELRVRGVAGLRVADASVIPRLPRGHTNWPTVMVAEKAAGLLRRR
ncbi:MAG TPA: GMC family oxidoreductase N-terminal domain-containing protein [Solirubrobacteraceae bacterium]|nr:GMC family oxidoreductase N-terminal domain-containing protein [Solirubrobacteraceae bacterium]